MKLTQRKGSIFNIQAKKKKKIYSVLGMEVSTGLQNWIKSGPKEWHVEVDNYSEM